MGDRAPADTRTQPADTRTQPADTRTQPVPSGPAGPRVLIVTVVHDPQDARIRHRQLASLLDAGFQITYAAPFAAYGRVPPTGVRAVDLPRARGRRRLRAVRTARELIRREAGHQDVVLVHDPDLLLALIGLRSRGGLRDGLRDGLRGGPHGSPVRVWDVHEDTAAALGMRGWMPRPLRRPAGAAIRLLERWADRRLQLLLAEDAYAQRFARPHPVIPNSVLVPTHEPPPPGPDRVVYLGRLTVPRGALELVELARLLHGQVEVDLVGPADPDCADAVARAAGNGWLRHRGFVPNDEAIGLLAGALAGLSLLRDEPNYAHSRPTKAMEYMAQGIPVITTPNRASAELVERYGSGLVVPFEDPQAAAEAVLRLRVEAGLRRELGSAGRRAAVAELSWQRTGTQLVEIMREWSDRGHAAGAGSRPEQRSGRSGGIP